MKGLFYTICLMFLIIGASSCEQPVEESYDVSCKTLEIECKIKECSDFELQSLIQSDAEFILLQHITIVDGAYFLNISEEEAMELNIPSSLYEQYLNYVNNLNSEK